MKEQSSEEIAHRQGRNQMIRKWLTFLAPTTVILAIFLIIFVDSRAIVLSFSFVIFGLLLVIFTIGSGNKNKRKARIYKDYSVKTIRPGSSYSPQHPGANQSGDGTEFQHEMSSAEEYRKMKEAYNNPQIVVVQSKGGDNNSKSQQNKQSQLGSQISNTALVGLMVAAAIVLWLFGGGN